MSRLRTVIEFARWYAPRLLRRRMAADRSEARPDAAPIFSVDADGRLCGVLVLAEPAQCFSIALPPGSLIDGSMVANNFTFCGGDAGPLVTISRDGSLQFHDGYTPDAAAQAFWTAIAGHAPDRERPR